MKKLLLILVLISLYGCDREITNVTNEGFTVEGESEENFVYMAEGEIIYQLLTFTCPVHGQLDFAIFSFDIEKQVGINRVYSEHLGDYCKYCIRDFLDKNLPKLKMEKGEEIR